MSCVSDVEYTPGLCNTEVMRLEPIPGYEGYFAREDGVIFSNRRGALKPLKPHAQRNGPCWRQRVMLGQDVCRLVNRLVCMAFHGEPPTLRHEAAHLNGDSMDNRAENLAWKTSAENAADRIPHGTMIRGSDHGLSKLTEGQVREMRALHGVGWSGKDLCDKYGMSKASVSRIVNGKTWTWLT